MLRAILFDFNGILVDDEPIHLELFQKVLDEEGVELTAADYYSRYVGLDDRGCFTAVLEAAGEPVTVVGLSRLIARKAAYYQQRIREGGFPVFPGVAELVHSASAAGLMLGVVSGALRNEVEGALRQIGIQDAFKFLITAEDVEAGKPDPQGYRRGLELLNSLPPLPARLLHPHEVLAIEDTAAGLEAAVATGLATLGVAHTYPADQLAVADHRVESLVGLTAARLQALFAGRS